MAKEKERDKERDSKVLGEISQRPSSPATRGMPMLSPIDEIDRLFDDFLTRGGLGRALGLQRLMPRTAMPFEGRVPSVDVIDRDSEIMVRAELPGVSRDDLDISVTENTLTIKASSRHEEQVEEGDYQRCEISRGSFSRTLGLPGYVDSAKASASFRDGILELTLPKLEQARPRKINVQ